MISLVAAIRELNNFISNRSMAFVDDYDVYESIQKVYAGADMHCIGTF